MSSILSLGAASGAQHPHLALALAVMVLAIAVCGALIARDRSRPARRRRREVDEPATRAAMTELAPDGWQARIGLYGWKAPVPEDAPPARMPQVRLELIEYERTEDGPRPVGGRRLWAPSIADALADMVDRRGADRALEQAERPGSEE